MSQADNRMAVDDPRLTTRQPWATLAVTSLGLNFVWEMLQAPLYEDMLTMPRWEATWFCARASAGDAMITLVAYGGVAIVVRSRDWIVDSSTRHVAGYVVIGLAASIALEYLNVYGLGRWSYAASMPRILGVGLAPIVQWLILPLPILFLARLHLRCEATRGSNPTEIRR